MVTSHVVEVGDALLDHRLALLEVEQRLALLRVAHRGDDDLVEEPGGRLDDLEVAVVDRVERPRVEDARQRGSGWLGRLDSGGRTIATNVPP